MGIRRILLNYFTLREQTRRHGSEKLLCLLVDIDIALSSIALSNRDIDVLSDYMMGYSFAEIGKEYSFTRSNADFIIKKISEKIRAFLLGDADENYI